MKSVSIIGSCVCRDLFKSSQDFQFFGDVRFQSPFSIVQENHMELDQTIFEKNLKKDDSPWFRKNILKDLNKTVFSSFKEIHGEYLVIDFSEARLFLCEINHKGKKYIFTFSSTFKNHYNEIFSKTIFKEDKIKIIEPLNIDDSIWKDIINSFSEEILKIYPQEKILLLETKPAKNYIDADGRLRTYSTVFHLSQIHRMEILTDKLNSFFKEKCPKCNAISMPKEIVGNEIHDWGNHPLHYDDVCYKYILAKVNSVILNEDKTRELLDYEKQIHNLINAAKLKSALYVKESPLSSIDYNMYMNNDEHFQYLSRKKKVLINFICSGKIKLK